MFFNTLYHGCWFASFYGLLGNRQLGDTVTQSENTAITVSAYEPRPSMKVDSTALHSDVLMSPAPQ